MTLKVRTRDSQLAYLIGQLENLDPKLHEPLVSVSWGRDIKLRPGVSFANEVTSFTRNTFAAVGTMTNADQIPFISDATTAIPGVSVNGEKINTPLRVAAREISYTSIQLEKSQLLQQNIDQTQTNALQTLYQMDIDRMVYVGSTSVGATGLVNNTTITTGNVVNGVSGTSSWATKTPDEILADVNTLLNATWSASGFAVCPTDLLVPPAQFSILASRKVSSAGNMSILKYLKENTISLQINGTELNINPVKWLTGRGAGSTDRMVAYTNDLDRVRFPMVPIRRETPYYQGIKFSVPYIYGLGEVEFVYPETVQYADGI